MPDRRWHLNFSANRDPDILALGLWLCSITVIRGDPSIHLTIALARRRWTLWLYKGER